MDQAAGYGVIPQHSLGEYALGSAVAEKTVEYNCKDTMRGECGSVAEQRDSPRWCLVVVLPSFMIGKSVV